MTFRLAAGLVLAGLTLSGPARAEPGDLGPEFFLDPNEAETAALIAADLAKAGDIVLAQLPLVDPPGPLAILAVDVPLPPVPEPLQVADFAVAAPIDVEAALAPELFLDAQDAETYAIIAADLATLDEFATGSLPSLDDAALQRPDGEACEFYGALPELAHALTDDAFAMQAYLTP
jgi:hypothetical protein